MFTLLNILIWESTSFKMFNTISEIPQTVVKINTKVLFGKYKNYWFKFSKLCSDLPDTNLLFKLIFGWIRILFSKVRSGR